MSSTDAKPLEGLRVLVTRSRDQAGVLAARLADLGAQPICLPMIEIQPPASWDDLDDAISRLAEFDWVVFASVNAVEYFCGRLDSVWTAEKPRFATIGPSTSAALRKYGMLVSYQSREFVAESFVEGFPDYPDSNGLKVLWPKANIGRTLIVDKLRAAGAEVKVVECYRTVLPNDTRSRAAELAEMLDNRAIDVLTFASAQTVKNFRAVLDTVASVEKQRSLLGDVRIAAIGPETARAAREQLSKCDLEAEVFTIDGIIDALVKCRRA